jgi:dienelactone hydrolase
VIAPLAAQELGDLRRLDLMQFRTLFPFHTGLLAAFGVISLGLPGSAADKSLGEPSPQMEALGAYFEQQVSSLEGQLDREIKTKEDWLAKKDEYRRQLAEMLGLDPMPPRTDLRATKTGEFEHEGIMVENLNFQAMPGLYVTANLYRPKVVGKPLPTVLYVCGHATKVKDGVSYGNKTGYEHHGVWYAKHGFVCLVIDTVELGEIHGEHHGTYSKGRFWWWSRGYTPAGVEAWQGIRALDYLETRPEVDKTRFGLSGRSGGGAYSWYIAALDERIKAAAPTAGITTLRNHVIDGCVAGHCDCMFMNNTYRWDYDKVAALVAPRALCICNTDKDGIFPIDGVFKVYQNTRRIYKLLGAEQNIGLQFAEGPHADTQPLNTGEFHWMTRFLQGADRMATTDSPMVHGIPMEELKVFKELPKDERNTTIDETFVAKAAEAKLPGNAAEWKGMCAEWINGLKAKSFAAWPTVSKRETASVAGGGDAFSPHRVEADGIRAQLVYASDSDVGGSHYDWLPPIILVHRAGLELKDLELVALHVLDADSWQDFVNTFAPKFPHLFPKDVKVKPDAASFESEKKMHESFKWGMAYVCPRGIGPTAWDVQEKPSDPKAAAAEEKARVQRLRRFYLLGQTLEGQQVWDIRCAVRALRNLEGLKDTKLWLTGNRTQAANVLMASLFEDGISRIDLHDLPHSFMPTKKDKAGHPITDDEPAYLNVLKILDIPQAVAMASQRTRVVIYDDDKAAWSYPQQLSEKFEWGKDKKAGLQLRDVPKAEAQ